jgi:uncharacterized membrane protein
MTTGASPSSWLRRALRLALMATSATLAMGLVLSLLMSGPAAQVANALLWTGFGLLVSLPVFSVIAVLLDEWRAPDRRFAAAAAAVLLLLAYTIVTKLRVPG